MSDSDMVRHVLRMCLHAAQASFYCFVRNQNSLGQAHIVDRSVTIHNAEVARLSWITGKTTWQLQQQTLS